MKTILTFALVAGFATVLWAAGPDQAVKPAHQNTVSDQDVRDLAAQFYADAVAACKAGDLRLARKQLTAALRLDPALGKAKALLGAVEKELGITDKVRVNEKLAQRIPKVEFEQAHLREVVDYLAREADVNIVFDASALAMLEGPETEAAAPLDFEAPEPPAAGTGTETVAEPDELPPLLPPEVAEQPVAPRRDLVTIRLKNVPLKEVLKYVLRFKGLKYIVEDYAILIVPINWADSSELVTEVFRLTTGDTGARQIQEHLARESGQWGSGGY